MFILTMLGLTLESDVYRRQILTSKVDPRTVRVKGLLCRQLIMRLIHYKCWYMSRFNPSTSRLCSRNEIIQYLGHIWSKRNSYQSYFDVRQLNRNFIYIVYTVYQNASALQELVRIEVLNIKKKEWHLFLLINFTFTLAQHFKLLICLKLSSFDKSTLSNEIEDASFLLLM